MADECPDIQTMQYLSPAMHIITRQIIRVAEDYLKAKMIDLGCGHMTFKKELERIVGPYDTLDIEARIAGVTYIGSMLDMHMIADEQYDSAITLAVLEHVPDPFQAVKEISRILKRQGTVVITVPHMSRLHEIPHDYFRFTEFGLKELLSKNGFEVVHMERSGTIISYLMHQVSTVLVGLTWHIPVLKQICFFLNKILIVLPVSWLDSRLARHSLMPMNYICVGRKM